MLPKAENVSYRALLSMDLSRFLMKMFPTPLLRSDGVSLGPHDADGPALDHVKVHRVQGALG